MVKIKLSQYDTIDFNRIGDRLISEYIFGEYYDSDGEALTNRLSDIDTEQENFPTFLESLDDKFKDIKSKPIKDLFGAYLDLNDVKRIPKTLLVSEIDENIDDLDDSDKRSKLSLLGQFSRGLQSLTLSSKNTPSLPLTSPKELEEMKEEGENDKESAIKNLLSRPIKTKIINAIADEIDYEISEDELRITLDDNPVKIKIMKEEGVGDLKSKPFVTMKPEKFKIKITEKKTLTPKIPYYIELEGNDAEALKRISKDLNALLNNTKEEKRQIKRLFTIGKIGIKDDEMVVKSFFINLFNPIISNILQGNKITMVLSRRPSSKPKNDSAKIDLIYTITKKEYKITQTALLEGTDYSRPDNVSRAVVRRGQNVDVPLPSHFSNSFKTMSFKQKDEQKRQMQKFFSTLSRRKNRLGRTILRLRSEQ